MNRKQASAHAEACLLIIRMFVCYEDSRIRVASDYDSFTSRYRLVIVSLSCRLRVWVEKRCIKERKRSDKRQITGLYESNLHSGRFEFARHPDGNSVVGNDTVQFVDIGNVNETSFVELRGVEDRNDLSRLLHHNLVEQRFLKIGRAHTVLKGERVHAEEQFVASKVTQDRKCERSDHRVAVGTHVSAQQYDIESLVLHQFGGDVHGVSQNTQVVELPEMSCDLERSCA